jgi:uncharacterized protein
MNIEEKITADIKTAMLAKDAKKLEDSVNKNLAKEVKKRKETAEIYKTQNRPDLEEVELFQAAVIEEYLPKQLSEADIKAELKKIIASVGASGPGDLGKVMGAASKAFAGKADNKLVSALVKEILG